MGQSAARRKSTRERVGEKRWKANLMQTDEDDSKQPAFGSPAPDSFGSPAPASSFRSPAPGLSTNNENMGFPASQQLGTPSSSTVARQHQSPFLQRLMEKRATPTTTDGTTENDDWKLLTEDQMRNLIKTIEPSFNKDMKYDRDGKPVPPVKYRPFPTSPDPLQRKRRLITKGFTARRTTTMLDFPVSINEEDWTAFKGELIVPSDTPEGKKHMALHLVVHNLLATMGLYEIDQEERAEAIAEFAKTEAESMEDLCKWLESTFLLVIEDIKSSSVFHTEYDGSLLRYATEFGASRVGA